MNIFLVVPTIRNLNFFDEWGDEFKDVSLLVIQDGPKKTVGLDQKQFKNTYHFCWQDITDDMREREWIFSRKNAGIRSYGFWKAYEMGADVVVTLDDDCYPAHDRLIEGHLSNLKFKSHGDGWVTTYPGKEWMYTRGFPYNLRGTHETWVSHGLWSGALDLDGETEVKNDKLLDEKAYPSIRQVIPRGVYYPMCSMNLAFVREAIPLMFFPMMGEDQNGKSWEYGRFDDIWAGILSKKVLDQLGYGVVSGSPFVEHRKKSIPRHNLEKEKAGQKVNEDFWKWVDAVRLTKVDPIGCYVELAEKINFPNEPYFKKLQEAMIIWAGLF